MIKNYFSGLLSGLALQWKSISFGVNDFFDILFVAVILYYAYKFIRDRRAGKLAVGLLLLVLISFLSNVFSLNAISYLINNFFQIGLLAIVVIFQPELRSALEKAGGNSLKSLKNLGEIRNGQSVEQMIENVCEASCEMSKDKTGALIVFENETKLGDIISSGTVVNADVSSYLLRNIFFENTPLHDGAVVIRDGRIYAAGCFLPLSSEKRIAKELGTRHRAAIGMSEVSDALVIVVSEETGIISVVCDGKIKRNMDYKSLKNELEKFFGGEEEKTVKKKIMRKSRKKNNSGTKNGTADEKEKTKDKTEGEK